MPFQSKAQQGAAFGGELGPEMQAKARTWAKETPNLKALPQHVRDKATVKPGKGSGKALAGLKAAIQQSQGQA